MSRPHKVTLRESELQTASDAQKMLARELDFPDYYGYNLDALEDCLSEICTPTRIVLVRDGVQSDGGAWFDALEEVVRESAQRSCYLGCTIRVPRR